MIGVRSLFGHTVGRKPEKYWTSASFSAFNVHEPVINQWLAPLMLMLMAWVGILEWIKAVTSKGPWPTMLLIPAYFIMSD